MSDNLNLVEERLMSYSTPDDLTRHKKIKPLYNKILDTADVLYDLSVISRVLIRANAGWPFYPQTHRAAIIRELDNLLAHAVPMDAMALFRRFAYVVGMFPDRNVRLRFGPTHHAVTKFIPIFKNVGTNIGAQSEYINIEYAGKSLMVGLPKTNPMIPEQTLGQYVHDIRRGFGKSGHAIVDLRGCTDNSSHLLGCLAGAFTGIFSYTDVQRIYGRMNADSKMLFDDRARESMSNRTGGPDDLIWRDFTNVKYDFSKSPYKKHICILTDRHTSGPAATFCGFMRQKPNVTIIGDRTAGMDSDFTWGRVCLPVSKMCVFVPSAHRQLCDDDVQMNGYRPDIYCNPGADALYVALDYMRRGLGK